MVSSYSAEQILSYMQRTPANRRGFNVYHMTDIIGVNAVDKWGERHQVGYQRPMFTLTVQERIEMAKFSAMIFGVITGRMNRIGALEWNVYKESDQSQRLINALKDLASIYEEWEDVNDVRAVVMRGQIIRKIREYLPDIRPDMQNFKQSVGRYQRRANNSGVQDARRVEDWLLEPNPDYSFEEFTKQWVFDLHTHGATAIYKDLQDGIVENMHILPGGSVLPIHSQYISGVAGYVQITPWGAQPQLMFNDEISFSRWLPSSATSYGLVPLESLVNKVAEQLLFDEMAAQQADGTKPPEKVVVFGDTSPFGDLDKALEVPLEQTEQKKIETALNEARKHAIRTLSGVGRPLVLDLSKADLFGGQSERQRQLKEDVGLVFGASNMEMNLTGSASTSGRATSETEERQDLRQGVMPIIKIIQEKLNRDILPYRFGSGYKFKFASGMSDVEEIELMTKKAQSGIYSVNEIRAEDLGLEPYPEDEYDRPSQQQPQMAQGEGGGLFEGPF